MKSSKLFLTSLLAAAALSAVPAWADSTWAVLDENGYPQTTGFTTISEGNPTSIGANSIATFTAATNVNTNGYSLQINGSGETTLGNISGGGAVWIKSGRWKTAGSAFTNAGDLYVLGTSQLQLTGTQTISNNVFLGETTFSTDGDLTNSALRVGVSGSGVTANLSKVTILNSGAKIGFQATSTLEISNLTGAGDITTGVWDGNNNLNVTGATSYTGKINVVSGVTLNWSADSTFGGLSGNGKVAAGSKLNIAKAGSDSTEFTGTVGTSGNGVALALTGSGTQSFTGTSYFSTVSVADTAALTLGGNVTLGSAIDNAGSVMFSSGAVVEIGALGTLFDTTQNGKIDFSDSQFTIATGTGTVSGLTASGIRVNGVESFSNVTVADDCKSVSVSGSVYNIASGSTATISEATTAGTVDFINVLGTLTGLGSTSTSTPIYGTGTVRVDTGVLEYNDAEGRNETYLETFEGVLDISGTGEVKLGNYAASKLTKVSKVTVSTGGTLSFWGSTFSKAVELSGGTLKSSGGTTGFSGSVTATSASTLEAASGYTIAISGAVSGAGALEKTGAGTLTLTGNNSGFSGGLKATAGVVGVNNSNALGSGTLTLNGGTLREDLGDLSFSNTINVTAASTINTQGYTMTLGGAVTGTGTLTKTGASGTLVLSGNTLSLSDLVVSEGTVQVRNSEATSGRDKTLTKVTLANGTTLQQYSGAQPTAATTIGELALSGATATLAMTHFQGYWNVDKLDIGEQTSATLNLESSHTAEKTSIFEFGSEGVVDVGNFAGTFNVTSTADNNYRSVSVVLSNGDIAKNAVVNLASATSTTAYLSLGVNASRVKIAGLISTLGDKAGVYSGKVATEITGNGLPTSGSTKNTLVINTAEGGDYSFNGEILANLNLEKTGAGTQTLAGASTAFNGSVKVSGGVLALADASAIGSGNAVRIDGGQLKIGNGTTAVSLNAAAYTIVLSDAYSADSGVAAIVGTDTTNKSSVALATDTKITIELADSVAVSLAAEAAQYQYKIFDATTIDDASFSIDSFALSEALKSDWRISDYTNGVLTIAAIPEPSMFGLLAGLGALALVGTRRRRKKA